MEQHTDKRFNLDLALEKMRNNQLKQFTIKTISHFYVLVYLGNFKYKIILNDGSIFYFVSSVSNIDTEYSTITYKPRYYEFQILPFMKK